ncbi:unnamed protein product [Trifolium pratense]|uniref:Uncharacterized protein n=1 Tax=Trifolium pratense TaxID=57577 RepID=A0ACB0J730_TRIPR|nr:unnamed protein product [Trifolium pratense]
MKEAWRFITYVVIIGMMVSFQLNSCHGLVLEKMRERMVRYPLEVLLKWNGKEGVIDTCFWFGVECNVVTLHIGQQGDIPYSRKLMQTENSANSHKTKKVDDKETSSPSSSPFSKHISPSQSVSNSPSPSIFLQSSIASPELSPSPSISPSPSPVIAPTTSDLPLTSNPPTIVSTQEHSNWISATSPTSSSNQRNSNSSNQKQHSVIIWSTVGGFSLLVLVSFAVFVCFRSSKVATVKPWATGLSGQLRKAFVTGIPSLKRAELVVACEDFSNIIGSLQDETIYKGTLSSGVEIAVVSSSMTSSQDWSKNMQAQFRKKIEMLSRVNHKNFVNLIGYCEENKPFTRMMVFEYAPNGTLFEHLHNWAAEYIKGQPLRELVDTTILNSLKDHEIEKWSEVINNCVDLDQEKRPSMKEITSKLKEITDMEPDGVTPKSSPLWWAEVEIMSTDLC